MIENALLGSVEYMTISDTPPERCDANLTSTEGNSVVPITSFELHHILKYIPCTRKTLSAIRTVCKPWRHVVECAPNTQFGSAGEIFLSRHGQCAVFHVRRATPLNPLFLGDELYRFQRNCEGGEEGNDNGDEGVTSSSAREPVRALLPGSANKEATKLADNFSFQLHCCNPAGRKFRDHTARILARNFEQVYRGLTVLHIHLAEITNVAFEILGNISTLKELQLLSCRNITSISSASSIVSLQVLEVASCSLDPNGTDAVFLPNLKKLRISSCSRLECVNGISQETAMSLTSLDLSDCPLIADDGCNEFFAHLTRVVELNVSFTSISESLALLPAEGLASLQLLQLNNTPVTTELLSACGEKMTALAALRVEMCESLLSLEFIEFPRGSFPRLTALDISSNDCSHYESLAACEGTLLSLRVAGSNSLSGTYFLQSLKNLTTLDFAGSSITDTEIAPIGKLSLLEVLVLSGCTCVRNINAIGNCSQLKRLLANQMSLTDDGILSIARCGQLEYIDLSGNDEITSINHLSGLSKLRNVNVLMCYRMRTKGYNQLGGSVEITSHVTCFGSEEEGEEDDAFGFD